MQRLIDQLPLRRGAHPTRDDGMCAMEMVAWLAGERHSDEPACTCPVLAAFVRATNDALGDAARNRLLRPLVPLLVNTRATAARERQRGLCVVDVVVRQLVPAALRRERRTDEAQLLEQLPRIDGADTLATAARALRHYARHHHAADWVVQRALDGASPARYVAGAIQVARTVNHPAAFEVLAATIVAMANLGRLAEDRAAADVS